MLQLSYTPFPSLIYTLILIGLYTIPTHGYTQQSQQNHDIQDIQENQPTWAESYKRYTINVDIQNDSVVFDYTIHLTQSATQEEGQFKTESLDTFLYILTKDLDPLPTDKNDMLFFIHGFMAGHRTYLRMTLEDFRDSYIEPEVSSLARIIAYRWPANLPIYKKAKNNAHFVAPYMAENMATIAHHISQLNTQPKINVMAHSLGNELFKDIVHSQNEQQFEGFKFNEVILAAPDLDTDVFEDDQPLSQLLHYCDRATTYLSHRDLTLTFSSKLNDCGRLGLDGPTSESNLRDQLCFIDMTEVRDEEHFAFRFNGHNYHRDSPVAMHDMLSTLIGRPYDQFDKRVVIDSLPTHYKMTATQDE